MCQKGLNFNRFFGLRSFSMIYEHCIMYMLLHMIFQRRYYMEYFTKHVAMIMNVDIGSYNIVFTQTCMYPKLSYNKNETVIKIQIHVYLNILP